MTMERPGTRTILRLSPGLRAVAPGVVAALSAVLPAEAGDLCVTCSDPPAVYRCQVEGVGAEQQAAASAQVLCAKELATRGGHSICAINRGQTAGACPGQLVVIAKPQDNPVATAQPAPSPEAPPAANGSEPQATASPTPAEPQTKPPPATLEAMAKDAATQSKKDWDKTTSAVSTTTQAAGDEIKKAGSTVGSALKKSWNCVVSLFSSC